MGRAAAGWGTLTALLLAAAPLAAQGSAAADSARPAAADTTRGSAAPAVPLGSPVSGWAVLAYDATSGELGLVAATDRFSAGSGVPFLDRAAGAVAVLGRLDAARGRSALETLRGGGTSEAAVGADSVTPGRSAGGSGTGSRGVAGGAPAAGGEPGAGGAGAAGPQLGALTPACSAAARTPAGLEPWSGSDRGVSGGGCWLVMGTGLADSTLLARLESAFRSGGGDLLDRFMDVLEAAGKAEDAAPRSRSAVVWIAAAPGTPGPLGRGELHLQVDDVQRPADALREVADAGRADALAAHAEDEVDTGQFLQALDLAKRAVDIEPATALAWLARGRALLFLNRPDEAEDAFQRMLEVDPWMLRVLGDPLTGSIRPGVIPYRPRLLQRLDVYRKAFWPDVDFPSDSTSSGG